VFLHQLAFYLYLPPATRQAAKIAVRASQDVNAKPLDFRLRGLDVGEDFDEVLGLGIDPTGGE
jgi:hypothetical protein